MVKVSGNIEGFKLVLALLMFIALLFLVLFNLKNLKEKCKHNTE